MTDKRVIFESEEEASVFFKSFFGIEDIGIYENNRLMDIKDIIKRLKDIEVIRRNPVEEAEEMINFNLTHHREYIKIEEQKKILTAIQYLKEK